VALKIRICPLKKRPVAWEFCISVRFLAGATRKGRRCSAFAKGEVLELIAVAVAVAVAALRWVEAIQRP